jgi:hypothetical protein
MSEKNTEKNNKKKPIFTEFDREVLARLPLTKEQMETIFRQLREPSESEEPESYQEQEVSFHLPSEE